MSISFGVETSKLHNNHSAEFSQNSSHNRSHSLHFVEMMVETKQISVSAASIRHRLVSAAATGRNQCMRVSVIYHCGISCPTTPCHNSLLILRPYFPPRRTDFYRKCLLITLSSSDEVCMHKYPGSRPVDLVHEVRIDDDVSELQWG